MPRRTLAILLVFAAVAAACGGGSGSSSTTGLDAVEVSGEAGEQPELDFAQPFEIDTTTTRVVFEGDGEPIADNAIATFHFVFLNGRDGTELSSSYGAEPAELVFEDSLLTGIYDGLTGVKAGSRVLVGIAPGDGLGADEDSGVRADDTLLFFAEVLGVRLPLARAEGEAVPAVDGLPRVTLAANGAPSITPPEGDPPAELIAQPLIEGAGDVVEEGQSLTVHYTGVLWNTGEVFDSSWEGGSPIPFDIGTGAVIAGWDEGLVGRKVGSQVLLVIPPSKAYPDGSPDGSISATDTLVFVVDILDASG